MKKITLSFLTLFIFFSSFSQENLKDDIVLFPNTASTQVNLVLKNNIAPTDISVYNLTGQLIKKIPLNNGTIYNIDTRELPQGMYLVAITTAVETQVKKFVVDPSSINAYSYYNGSNEKVTNKISLTVNIGVDEIVSVDTPNRVDRESTTNVSVAYSASTARDIYVAFKLSSSPYTLYQSAVVSVSTGSGTVQVPIAVPSDALVADYSYRYQVLLLPTGQQGYNNRLGEAYLSSISVIDSTPAGIDEIVSVDTSNRADRG